ncbi:MAG TPA: glycosyltransferase [Acidobacteriota bacterium]|nr:glycosyltransferase [Acidobacteriota bacterium]
MGTRGLITTRHNSLSKASQLSLDKSIKINPRIAILIVGMHRSGTSLCAGILRLLGVDFGQNLMLASPNNEKGYFEHNELYQINEDILKTLNTSWDDVKPLEHNWYTKRSIAPFKKKIESVLQKEFNATQLFGIKDPRISLLLPLYKDILTKMKVQVKIIAMYRKDLDVAKSLNARDSLELAKGLELYDKYNRNIDQYASSNSISIYYDDLIQFPKSCIEKIKDKLQIPIKDYGSFESEIVKFIDPRLKHQSGDDALYMRDVINSLRISNSKILNLQNQLRNKEDELKNQVTFIRKSYEEKQNTLKQNIDAFQTKIKELEKQLSNQLKINEQISQEDKLKSEKIAQLLESVDSLKSSLSSITFELKNANLIINTKQQEILDLSENLNTANIQKEALSLRVQQLQENLQKFAQRIENERNIAINVRQNSQQVIRQTQQALHQAKEKIKTYEASIQNLTQTLEATDISLQHAQEFIVNVQQSLSYRCTQAIDKIITSIFHEDGKIYRTYIEFLLTLRGTKNKAKRRKHIVFVNHEETRTGAPKILFEIAKHVQRNARITVISLKQGSMHTEFSQTFKNIKYPQMMGHAPSEQVKIKQMLRKIQPDLVFANSIVSWRYAAAAKSLHIPTILHVHELHSSYLHVRAHENKDSFRNCADIFIAVSLSVKNYLLTQYNIDDKKIQLVHEFIDVNEIRKLSEEYVPQLKKENEVLVVCIGSITKRKGVDYFLQLQEILTRSNPNIKLMWIGGQHGNINYLDTIDPTPSAAARTAFIGELPNPYAHLKQADIFLLTSHEDPFPLAALEAMALSKPIVAFESSGGVAEMVEAGNGILVKEFSPLALAQAIRTICTSLSAFKERSSKILIERFDIRQGLSNIDNVIRIALRKK